LIGRESVRVLIGRESVRVLVVC